MGIGSLNMNIYNPYMENIYAAGTSKAGAQGMSTGQETMAGENSIELPGDASGAREAAAGSMGTEKADQSNETQASKPVVNPGESTQVQPGKKSSPAECQTCKERKYQDGSDEGDVSYKAPTHIDPSASTARTMAHEQEHVANAYEKASKGNGRVLQASVQLKMAVCPECGRSYCAGGTTTTKIRYGDDDFSQNQKSLQAQALVGANFDAAV